VAVNDGDSVDLATRVAGENGFAALLVTDPERRVSRAYGITIWPTIVEVDAGGVVRRVQHGRPAARQQVAQHV